MSDISKLLHIMSATSLGRVVRAHNNKKQQKQRIVLQLYYCFYPLFPLTMICMHNEVWGCAEIQPKCHLKFFVVKLCFIGSSNFLSHGYCYCAVTVTCKENTCRMKLGLRFLRSPPTRKMLRRECSCTVNSKFQKFSRGRTTPNRC